MRAKSFFLTLLLIVLMVLIQSGAFYYYSIIYDKEIDQIRSSVETMSLKIDVITDKISSKEKSKTSSTSPQYINVKQSNSKSSPALNQSQIDRNIERNLQKYMNR